MSTTLNMYVLTDTHYLSEKMWKEGEPINSREQGDQVAIKCSPEILDTFFDKIIADEQTNIVLITGDLVNNGDRGSHEDFIKALEKLTKAGKTVFVTTATHDYNGFDTPGDENFFRATYYEEDKTSPAPHVSRADIAHLYDDFGPKQADSVDESSGSYSVLLQEGYRLIALNDNGNGRSHCGLFEDGFAWLLREIDKAEIKHEKIILAVHHPVLPPWPVYERAVNYEMFGGYERLKRIMCEKDIHIIFTGHTHVQGIKKYTDKNGKYFYDITTSALVGAGGKMRKVQISPDNGYCKIESIGIETIKGIDTKGQSAHDYIYALNFTGRLEQGFRYIKSDWTTFSKMASGVIPKEITEKYRAILKPTLLLLTKTKMKTLAGICGIKRKKIINKTEYRELKNVSVTDVIFEIAQHIFVGNAPFSPDTPVYQTLKPYILFADKAINRFNIDLSKIKSENETLLDLADPFLYNNRTGDDDGIEFYL